MRLGCNVTSVEALDELLLLAPFETVQFYTHSTKPFERVLTDERLKYIQSLNLTMYVHSTFNTIMDQYYGRDFFVKQFQLCNAYGVKGIILHIPNRPVDELIAGFKAINDPSSQGKKTIIFLEHVPGNYGASIAKVHELYVGLSNKYKGFTFGICVDTCHMYSSGVNLGDRSKMIQLIEQLHSYKCPVLIHLNDSHGEFGSMIDKHAPFGTRIWTDDYSALELLMNQPWDAIIELRGTDNIQLCLDYIKKIKNH
jgi:endonuclease IV